MPERLALLISAAGPECPAQVVTPLVHALAARALDAEVEIHFAGPAVRWLVAGVAEAAFPTPAREKPVAAFLDELQAAGVRLYACGMARAAWVKPEETLRDGAAHAGATAFVARVLDPDWASLAY